MFVKCTDPETAALPSNTLEEKVSETLLRDLRAIGFSVADALAGNVTDLRAAGCIGLWVKESR